MKKYEVSQETIQAIINYLGTCQYSQVAPLLQRLQTELAAQELKETKKNG